MVVIGLSAQAIARGIVEDIASASGAGGPAGRTDGETDPIASRGGRDTP